MKIVRTWPPKIPSRRGHVRDDLPRYVINGYDYRGFFDAVDDDVLIVEWDIAVGAEQFDAMLDLIGAAPDRVVAAPYRVYLVPRDPGPHWVMRRYADDGELRWVTEDDASCHMFGFGLTYVPRDVWRAHAVFNPRGRVSDTNFSRWHHENVAAEVPIPWDIRPVHLHYPLPRGGDRDGSA